MALCTCCDLRLSASPCDCDAGRCVNCNRCAEHCGCLFGLREIVYEDDGEGEEMPTPDVVTVKGKD